ncbi:VTT domain-containing protein [Actinoplanes sp. NBRC 101535]|uniref:DedA family protein n=1 Tax=Actinoplanes sp. NBRC 101535 TaxID=3032196 RepID=UPI0024A5CFC7|nr:VTT domain-containing protein [Actinoplanes sp. NBRC 101535]GLY06620.1 membrane protein [Actinoplanes sp. NBRC 101535]
MDVLTWLQELPEYAIVAATGLLVLGEGIIGVGFFLPGEAALLLAAAAVGSIADFFLLWSTTVACSVAGNVVGFELGRRVGPPLRDTRLVRKRGAESWDKATLMLQKHGAWAVFTGRVIPFVRNVVPPVAGAGGLSYRMFLPAVTAGAAIATALPILFAVAIAQGAKGAGAGIVIAVLLAAAIAVFVMYRRRRR